MNRCLGTDFACLRGCRCVGTLGHILNNCNSFWNEMTERHNDVCKILSQYLNKFKSQIINVEENKMEEMKMKIGRNSEIKLPYKTHKEGREEEDDDEGFEEAKRRKPDCGSGKLNKKQSRKKASRY
jgi:hypothetical protein